VAVSGRDGRAGQDVLRRVGEASVLILISLADGPKHGYALIQDIKELAGVELGPGTLYGALDRLERLGLIESLPADDRRHPYRITAPGAAALRVHLESLERVSAAGPERSAVLPGPLAAEARGGGRRAGCATPEGRNPGGLDRL
jgi:DNA-binding PadR family transcriptional regulator